MIKVDLIQTLWKYKEFTVDILFCTCSGWDQYHILEIWINEFLSAVGLLSPCPFTCEYNFRMDS